MSSQNSTPEEARGPSGSPNSDQWVLKALGDLKADMQKMDERSSSSLGAINEKLNGIDARLTTIESRLARFFWTAAGAVLVIGALYAIFGFITNYVDITIAPKPD